MLTSGRAKGRVVRVGAGAGAKASPLCEDLAFRLVKFRVVEGLAYPRRPSLEA